MRLYRTYIILIVAALWLFGAAGCDGKAEELSSGSYLGDPTIDDGGTRTDGSDAGQIYTVTKIVEATNEIAEWPTLAELPFTGPRRSLGVTATDSQWPFKFLFTYPPNNYSIGEARLLLATTRDTSDTEGIFVDGVFTGRPPTNNPSGSANILYRHYYCPACTGVAVPNGPANDFYMRWAMEHYKIGAVNTFDLNLNNLINTTPLTIDQILNDGILRVVSGDDAIIESNTSKLGKQSAPLLIMEGYTISRTPLVCSQSSSYKLINTYVHEDGNSIASPAFSGTVLAPNTSWSTAYTTFRSAEFYYDVKLPTLSSYDNLNITKADIVMQVKRTNANPAGVVVNGFGVDQDGFDQTTSTAVVESWSSDAAARTYWNTFVTAIPANNSINSVTLNLLSLLGAAKVKELLLQGKLNVAVAGPLANVNGSGATSARDFNAPINGPELVLEGNFSTQICEVPDNPDSPLSGGAGGPSDCLTDMASPVISSVQVTAITSTSAKIQWLTNENSTSQVGYGVVSPNSSLTPIDSTPLTFHSITITGLQPYKYYQYNVRSEDSCGNETISGAKSFRTLR